MAMWRLLVTGSLAAFMACARQSSPRIADVVGSWEKEEQTLPPISLDLSSDGDLLRARLRLSGSESNGTAVLDGSTLRLSLQGREKLSGEFVSMTELRLRFGSGADAYILRKQNR